MRAGSLVILKMGSTLPSLKTRRGDFDDWIISGAGLSRSEVTVIDVPAGDPLPPSDGEAGVIVTGSHTMVTERKDWSERTADWLRDAVSRGLPVLGICYGHQLLAHALGGEVGNNPRGREFGSAEIALEEPAKVDELLGILPERFTASEGHTQSVLKLPKGAVRLASNEWDANQAFRIGDRAWGVQFHPEFDLQIVREYIEHYRDLLSDEGQDPDSLQETVQDNPHGPAILKRFATLCRRGD
jgi:GMP synthase (glutamine-hydrolysing)